MEKPKSPWEPSEAVVDLEFQRKALKDMYGFALKFAKENNITYIVGEEPDVFSVEVQEGDFETLRLYIEGVVNTLNKTLKHHEKKFTFEVQGKAKIITARAVPIRG